MESKFRPRRIKKLIDDYTLKKKGNTLKKVLDTTEIPATTFNYMINEKGMPSIEKVEKLARFFGVDMNYFFDYDDWTSVQTKPHEEKIPEITDVTPAYILDRYENLARENGILQTQLDQALSEIEKLKEQEKNNARRSIKLLDMPESDQSIAAEPAVELKREKPENVDQ